MLGNFAVYDSSLQLWGRNSLSIADLRTMSKRLHKDNPFIATFTKSFLQLVISAGLTLRIQTSNKDAKRSLKAIWESFASDSCVSGDMALDDAIRFYIASIIIDGDILVYVTERNGKLKLNHIPAWRVTNPVRKTSVIHFKSKEPLDLTGYFIDSGVVYYKGEVVGYTFSDPDSSKPHLYIPRTNGGALSAILLKSPISIDTDTVRGVPLLACGVKALDDITSLVNAETKSAKIRSKLAASLSVDASIFGSDAEKAKFLSELQSKLVEIEKNDTSILVPAPGTKLEFNDVKASGTSNFDLLIKPLLVYVAGLYGVSYDALSHDLKDNTSAIARLIYMTAWTDSQIWRNYFASKLLDPFFALLVEANGISLADVNWQINARPYGYVKSKEEVSANNEAITSGQKTLAEVAAESGKDVEDIISEQAEIEKYRNSVNPDYRYALDIIAKCGKAEVSKAILRSKGYTDEVINTLHG